MGDLCRCCHRVQGRPPARARRGITALPPVNQD